MSNHKKGMRAVFASAYDALRRKRTVAAVYFTLRFLVIAVMVAQFFNGDFESVFLCALTLVLFLLPTVFERALMIDLPNTMEIIIMLFIFAAASPWWICSTGRKNFPCPCRRCSCPLWPSASP